jgi:hypothetical protein
MALPELTRIRVWRQFKPFVYLNRPADRAPTKKAPPYGRAPLHVWAPKLLVLTLLLTGPVALAHRILLLLSGFLAAALLLLRRALAGVLTLLTRILVLLLRH